MNQIRRFMYGRYGIDRLNRMLVFAAFFISLIALFSRYRLINIGAYLLLAIVLVRSISKNIAKRSQENLVYCRFADSVKNKLRLIKLSLIGTKTHKYYKCSRCRQTIRIPRGKGKICITCPKCKAEFIRRT